MTELLQAAQPVLGFVQWVLTILFVLFMIFMRSQFAARKEQDAITARMVALEGRCDRMNDRMTQAPTSNELHQLQLSIVELNGKLAVHNERMEGLEDLHKVIKRQVEVMDDYLRDRK